MNKQNFLSSFYEHFVSDVIASTDEILLHCEPLPFDKPFFEVAKEFRKRPDIWFNICTLCRFVLTCYQHYDLSFMLSSIKVSPSWLAEILIFNSIIYECEKND